MDKLHIAVCDDEQAQAELYASIARDWGAQSGQVVQVETFGSAESFLYAWGEDRSFDVLFLDIQMPGENGIVLARRLRLEDERLSIVFVTGLPQFMEQGYEVEALHYLVKPVRPERIFSCLDRAARRCEAQDRTVLIVCGTGNIRLHERELLYAEAFSHMVEVHTRQGAYETSMGIGTLSDRLDPAMFFRAHRSYLVNLRWVSRIGREELWLDNGVRLPVSRRQYDALNRAFIAYHRGEAQED